MWRELSYRSHFKLGVDVAIFTCSRLGLIFTKVGTRINHASHVLAEYARIPDGQQVFTSGWYSRKGPSSLPQHCGGVAWSLLPETGIRMLVRK